MNADFLVMLLVYRCGLFGICPKNNVTITADACKYAVEQNILPMFYAGIEKLKAAGKIVISEEAYQKIKMLTLNSVMNNERRLNFVHGVLSELENKGIEYCVLKGESLSAIYTDKTCRISGDTDIYIDERDIDNVSRILEEKGFSVEPIFPTEHHMVARHPIGGVLECHFKLYDDDFSSFFKGYDSKKEDCRIIDGGYGKIKTLGINDGLNFVFFHYVKHFLSEGVGIRQLADVLMYARFYREQIDWEKFSAMLNKLGFKKLFDAIATLGTKFIGFSEKDIPVFCREEDLAEEILCDIQAGGVFGFNETDRKNFRYLLLHTKGENKKSNIKKVMRIAFPTRITLENKYSYLKKTVILYPLAWCHRVFDVMLLKKGRTNIKGVLDPSTTVAKSETVDKRMNMMKRLDIIE